MGYETYQETKLSIGQNLSTTPESLFSENRMEDHGSDAVDEITDVSSECLSSSNEFCDMPKDYYVSSGTKPLSLVIRRCSTPAIVNNSSVLKSDFNVSSPFTKEFESTPNNEVSNSDKKVNYLLFQKQVRLTPNATSPTLQESHIALGPTASDGTVRTLQEVSLSSSQQSNHSLITQEYTENVINGNDVHVKVSTTHTVENDHLKYMDGSTLQPSNPLLEMYRNDDVDGELSVYPVYNREVCQRVENYNIENRNQDSPYPLGSSKNIQSLIHTHPSEHCKQKAELSSHSSFEELLGESVAGNTVRITEGEGCKEMNAMDAARYESKIPTDVILDTDSFHIIKEQSASAEKICSLNLQIQSEPRAVGGKSVVKSCVIESLMNEVYEAKGIAIVSDSLKFQSSQAALLQVQGENMRELCNQTERGNELSTITSHEIEVSVGRNAFDEDYIVCAGKCEHEMTEVSLNGSETRVKNDTVKSETQSEIACEPRSLQNIDNILQKIEIKMPEDVSIINVMRNATVSISPTSVRCVQSSTKAENSENSHLVNCTQNRQTVSVEGDSPVQKCVQNSFDDEEPRTEWSVGLSPKNPIPLLGMDGVLITSESEKVQSVNIKAEDIKNTVCSSVLARELAEDVMASTDSHRDRFYEVSKTDNLQSSVHNSSLLVQSYTEDTLDCYNDVSSGAVFLEHSPLLFSSDDENSYYTGKII
jgi:hypothetical protein